MLTPVNSKSELNCRTLKKYGEIEKCCTINGIVNVAKKKKINENTSFKRSSVTLLRVYV